MTYFEMSSYVCFQLLNNAFVLNILLVVLVSLLSFDHGLHSIFHGHHYEIVAWHRVKTCLSQVACVWALRFINLFGQSCFNLTTSWSLCNIWVNIWICVSEVFCFQIHYDFDALTDVVEHLEAWRFFQLFAFFIEGLILEIVKLKDRIKVSNMGRLCWQ